MTMTEYIGMIHAYYAIRGLRYPTPEEALMWAMTELGEATDEILRKKDWVRNDPAKEVPFNLENFTDELGDIIMMVMVAGMVLDVDPLKAMTEKIDRKMQAEIDKMKAEKDERNSD